MRPTLILSLVAALFGCAAHNAVAPTRQRIAFDRPSGTDRLWTGPQPGTAVLRTDVEWQEFARRHARPRSIDSAALPRIDFQRFMLAALWRPNLSGCRSFTNWVDSVIGDRDAVRVFASPPPGGACQMLQNAFDVVCLPQDQRPVLFTIDSSFDSWFHPKKGEEPVWQPQKYHSLCD
jgi:hypothetical protein